MSSPEAAIAPDPYPDLVTALEALAAVRAAGAYYDDRSGSWRVEAIVERDHDTVPPAVLRTVADAGCGIRDATPRARYQDLRVVVE